MRNHQKQNFFKTTSACCHVQRLAFKNTIYYYSINLFNQKKKKTKRSIIRNGVIYYIMRKHLNVL